MPASSSFLRLLALGAFADFAEAFATLRKGMGVVEKIGTESAGFSGCMCAGMWQCNIDGPNSLENPPNSFNYAVLSSHVNQCWDMCYKNPAYMTDGSAAIFWNDREGKPLCHKERDDEGNPVDGDPSEIWRTGMCRKTNSGTGGKYTRHLYGDKIPSNPFKDSCAAEFRDKKKGLCGVNGTKGTEPYKTTEGVDIPGYKLSLCLNIGEQNTPDALADTRTAEERCALVVQENSAEITENFNPGMIKMRTDPRFLTGPAGPWKSDEERDTYICGHLYRYWELDGNRMYNRGEYDRTTGKCKQYVMAKDAPVTDPTNTRAQECKRMLCGYKQLDQCREEGLNQGGVHECFITSATGKNSESHQGALSYNPVTRAYTENKDPKTGKCRPDCGDPDKDCDAILDGTFKDPCPGACDNK